MLASLGCTVVKTVVSQQESPKGKMGSRFVLAADDRRVTGILWEIVLFLVSGYF